MKSKVRASGPIRDSSGTLSWRLRYSLSDSSVSIDIAHSDGCTSRALNAVGPASKKSARFPLASTSHTRVRRPDRAASRPSAAATVLLPTPPLPVTNSSRRSRSEMGSAPGEPDTAIAARGPDLDVGDLLHRHAHLPSPAIGQPEHAVGAAPERSLDLRPYAFGRLVVVELE